MATNSTVPSATDLPLQKQRRLLLQAFSAAAGLAVLGLAGCAAGSIETLHQSIQS